MMETIAQTMILICSAGGIFLISSKNYRFWGFAVSLCGQPFWFYTAWNHNQYSILLLSFWFTFCHIKGMRNNFRTKPELIEVKPI